MKVKKAKDFGFCFGVERAVNEILKILDSGKVVVTDGDIVHNSRVMNFLIEKGLVINKNFDDIEGEVFAIRAHGVALEKFRKIKEKFRNIADLTCPIVKSLFEEAKECEDMGYTVVVFGKDGHAEMEALKGHVKKPVIIREPIKLDDTRPVCVLSQTTSSWIEYKEFIAKLIFMNFSIKEFKILNTVCPVTVEREYETEKLSKECDLIVVVGGKHSANTGKLYRIAEKNASVIWVEDPNELRRYSIDNLGCVGIVSGTSTPKEDVEKVYEILSRRD